MTTVSSLRAAYGSAFQAHLTDPGEATLRAAYELGRDAVARGLSVLDLATAHHEALRAALGGLARPGDEQPVTDAASEFFLESLSAFEMLQRGLREAQETAAAEQHQAALLRQLSSFLGDASLALSGAGSLEEMLQLLAEQARELIEADCCVAFAALDERSDPIQAISVAEYETGWRAASERTPLFRLASLFRSEGGLIRLSEAELASDPAAISLGGLVGRPLRGVLAAPLTRIDGRELGSIHLFGPRGPAFSDVAEAQLSHLARLASAALERVVLYGRDRQVGEALQRGRHCGASCAAGSFAVAVRHRPSEGGGAVWFDTVELPVGGIALVAGDVSGPAATVAAAQARAAARALAASGTPPARLVADLAMLLERLAPDNTVGAAAVTAGGDQAQTAVHGAQESDVQLRPGTALVVAVGGDRFPAISLESGAVEEVCERAIARLVEQSHAETAVLAVAGSQ